MIGRHFFVTNNIFNNPEYADNRGKSSILTGSSDGGFLKRHHFVSQKLNIALY